MFYDPEAQSIVVGSAADMAASKKFRDAQRHRDVALVVDDLASVDPWTPRGIAICADLVDTGRVNVFERWESQAALETFRRSGP